MAFRRVFLNFQRLATASTLIVSIACAASAQEPLRPGEAFITRFSGTVEAPASGGGASAVIDVEGSVGAIFDLRAPGAGPRGTHWADEPQRNPISAAEVGQVFGVAIGGDGPDIFLSATSAFGLHRNRDNSGWMDGMWGRNGGPGTIYRLSAQTGYKPEIFADVTLDGRVNGGAGLGNLAIDSRHDQLFVSDMETGMIHRFALSDGRELGRFDHGETGRAQFFDVTSGVPASLPTVSFDRTSSPHIDDCTEGEFAQTLSCWNLADFRRRIWGLAVRNDAETGEARLFYATWGSEGFGNPAWAGADDDRRNAVWSIGLDRSGDFNMTDVRREFLMPDFRVRAEDATRLGPSQPVASISFSACGSQNVMLVAERGGMRNLGLGARDAFAQPHEARILRFERDGNETWQLVGRYDAGFYDRSEQGPPHIRANAAGGAAFGPGFNESWQADAENRNGFVWLTGDNLCTPLAACVSPVTGGRDDTSEVHGVQGIAAAALSEAAPEAAMSPYPASGPATPADAPAASFMIDLDLSAETDSAAGTEESRSRDATTIGSLAVFQPCPVEEFAAAAAADEERFAADEPSPFDAADVPEGEYWPDDYYSEEPFPDEFYPEDFFPGGFGGWEPPLDLAISKGGPAECQEGGLCTYSIEIRNAGIVPYFGPLAFADTVPEAAVFDAISAGWHCAVFGPEVRCHSDSPVGLAPGASVDADLGLTLPFGIVGGTVENCVAVDWDGIGFHDGEGDGNDRACTTTTIADPFDLGISKTSEFGDCAAGSECFYEIELTNDGPGEFSGPVVLAETLPPDATLVSASGAWGCSQADGEARCSRDLIELGVGDSDILTLGIMYPADTPDGPIENCIDIAFDEMAASDGDADTAPDHACDTVNIHHVGFDLAITKSGPARCDAGGLCRYSIEIANNGPNVYGGIVAFIDNYPAGSTVTDTPPFPWICADDPVGAELRCGRAPVPLGVGDSISVEFEIALPDPVDTGTVENCALLNWGVMPLDRPHDTNDEDCALTNVGEGFDLAIEKTSAAECVEGALCEYDVTITNNGPRDIDDPLVITDTLPDGAVVETVSDGWSCTPTGAANEISCESNDAVALLAGASATLTLDARLPAAVLPDLIENCATLDLAEIGYTGDDDDPANDGPACVTTAVVDDIGLFGGTSCDRGSSCAISVFARNTGGRTYSGMIAVNGSLAPAVDILKVIAPNDGWSCSITGAGTYRCGRTRPLRLEKGEEEKISIVLEVPAGFPNDTITHSFWMVRPQGEKRDANATNDANVSIITIKGPRPGPRSRPEQPELAIEKTAPASCTPGGDCTYSITVTNNGPGVYEGVLFIDDYPPGSTNADLVSYSPGWSCVQIGPNITCRRAPVDLAPGESISFSLTVRLPTETAAYGETMDRDGNLENCAWIVRPYGTVPLGMDAEEAVRFAVEQALAVEGFLAPDEVDGAYDAATASALEDYQRARRLTVTGTASEETLSFMFPASTQMTGDTVGDNDRSCATSSTPRRVEPVPPIREPLATLPECRGDEVLFRALGDVPQGWQRRRVPHEGRVYYCARPPQVTPPPAPRPPQATLPQCRKGEKIFRRLQDVPEGWTRRRVPHQDRIYFCARPPEATLPQCRKGEKLFRRPQDVPEGWTRRRVPHQGRIYFCARRPSQPPEATLPQCRKGEKLFRRLQDVPGGWTRRRVPHQNRIYFCARPPSQTPQATLPQCGKGEKLFRRLQDVPKGWARRRVPHQGRIYYCARPPRVKRQ